MAFWTYMLRCADGRYYIGHTDALEQRVAQHQSGKGCDYTARRHPLTLVWSESFGTRDEALAAERQVKGWSRSKKEALIAGDWTRVSELAASREARPSTSSGRTEDEASAQDLTVSRGSRPSTGSGRTEDEASAQDLTVSRGSRPSTGSGRTEDEASAQDLTVSRGSRPSTGSGRTEDEASAQDPFVLSEVEGRDPNEAPAP